MRPDVAAFRELDTLVRNLSEQLAGYRRRALSAESRARDLEHQITTLEAKLEAARETAAVATGLQQASAQSVASDRSPAGEPVPGQVAGSGELSAENERLRARLSEARERTALVADRVRFLRQQLSGGAER